MNTVCLIGRLTKDPEFSMTPQGIAVAKFAIAVPRKFANSNGERESDFFLVTTFRTQAESVDKYLKKGHKCGITGRLQSRIYDDNGKNRTFIEVIAESVDFLEPKKQEESPKYTANEGTYTQKRTNETERDIPKYPSHIEIDDDDLPF